MSGGAKVLVILLDAVERDLLLPWARDGVLPTFGAFLPSAVSAVALGPLGMHPGAAWASLFTGASPARHARHTDRQIRPGTYDTYRAGPSEVRCPPFWETVAAAGRRVAIIDVPDARLSPSLNGVQVVDWLPHTFEDGFRTTPPQLKAEIVSRFGIERTGLCDHAELSSIDQVRRFRDSLVDRAARKAAFSRHLLAQGGWDLFVTTFTETHCIGHRCWHFHDPSHPRHDPRQVAALGNPLADVYRAVDDGVGRLLAAAGDDTFVFVVSDVGLGPNFNGAHLLADVLFGLGYGPPPATTSTAWRALRWAWRRAPRAWRTRLDGLTKGAVDRAWPSFDPRWKCFAVNNGEVFGAIRVNLAGREPQGRVAPGSEYEAFCRTLGDELLALVNADTGAPAVRRVLRTKDIYDGPRLGALPDLLVEWSTETAIDAVRSPRLGTVRKPYRGPRTGHHRREGFLACRGPAIEPGELDAPIDMVDVAPTIAALLGVELGGVDGRPVSSCLPAPRRPAARRAASP
jgi:predicted AlkP superfamily phosphohydrolase/phosphomutase